ncbi:hypothetical protein GGR52DRAFT_591903 [Hypoxylon sp. FL1284]|nr:hypothetical protein GGR52DRAFT_591903 [Hypoxylon sp. FL1284]
MRSQTVLAAAAAALLSSQTAAALGDLDLGDLGDLGDLSNLPDLPGFADGKGPNLGPECQSALKGLTTALPQPSDPALSSFASAVAAFGATRTGGPMIITDRCSAAASLPTSLRSAVSSYEAQLADFASKGAAQFSSVASACGVGGGDGGLPGLDGDKLSSQFAALTASCPGASPTAGGDAGKTTEGAAGPTGDGGSGSGDGGSDDGGDDDKPAETNAAAPVGGFALAASAAAAAGLLGAVLLL